MFKGTPDGKKLVELSVKQVEQHFAYLRDKQQPIVRRDTPVPELEVIPTKVISRPRNNTQ